MAIVQVFSIMLLGVSCREVYFPDNLEQKEPMLSVHGILYEDNQPLVKLSRTIGYYEVAEDPVHNALVVVFNDAGRADTLTEVGQTGLYTISALETLGKIGTIYTLRIETEDGNIFESNPVKMPAKPVIESFYADSARRTMYAYNSQKKLISYVAYGISVYTNLASNGEDEQYYRFRTRAVEERTLATSVANIKYYRVANTTDLYDVAKSMLYFDQQMVNRHEDVFLKEPVYIFYEGPNQDPSFFENYIVTHRVYSISADVYDYFLSIKEQLTSENEIFAPAPTRIRSNIFCINNDAAGVIGVFEASSMETLYMSCRRDISEYYDYVYSTLLEELPEDLDVFSPPEYPAINP